MRIRDLTNESNEEYILYVDNKPAVRDTDLDYLMQMRSATSFPTKIVKVKQERGYFLYVDGKPEMKADSPADLDAVALYMRKKYPDKNIRIKKQEHSEEIVHEGGWASTATQKTEITPSIVKKALDIVEKFVSEFNLFLSKEGLPAVERGRPTGSSAYYQVDPEDKVYGDIDLQMIAQGMGAENHGEFSRYWNALSDRFVKEKRPDYVLLPDSTPGHPILKIGPDSYVQIDFMWHTPELASWGAARVIPEHGVKGLLFGNMFSTLGEILDLSIQHAGVQYKTRGGKKVPFSNRRDVDLITVTTNPETFILDTLKHFAKKQGLSKIKIDRQLSQNPGTDLTQPKISKLANGILGLAKSLQANNMFGKGDLAAFADQKQFINAFLSRYEAKALANIQSEKRDKAMTPQAIKRAENDRRSISQGLNMVKDIFAQKLQERWSEKYKRSIDCSRPRGFSQRAHCQGKKKRKK